MLWDATGAAETPRHPRCAQDRHEHGQPSHGSANLHVRAGHPCACGPARLPWPACASAVWLISLSRSIFDPIGFDQALYQYITDRVMLGQRLYTDVWDQNAPGIVGIHWLATVLVGRDPDGPANLRRDLARHDTRRLGGTGHARRAPMAAGWLAASLYALAYYGLGYTQTAQREGFAVLPLLLAVHALAPGQSIHESLKGLASRHVLAGAMCFVAFIIKPPLGLCFGVLWLMELAGLWSRETKTDQ